MFHTTLEASSVLGHFEDKIHKCRLTKVWKHRINNILIPWSKEANKLIKKLVDNPEASHTGKMQLHGVSLLGAERQSFLHKQYTIR